jgi:hypothetical protein
MNLQPRIPFCQSSAAYFAGLVSAAVPKCDQLLLTTLLIFDTYPVLGTTEPAASFIFDNLARFILGTTVGFNFHFPAPHVSTSTLVPPRRT